MKTRLIILFLTVCCGFTVSAQKKLLIGGSGWDKIVMLDKSTKLPLWEHALSPGEECNSVAVTPQGDILYSYGKGAKLITPGRKVIWDYPLNGEGEVQMVAQLPEGGYLLAINGHPAKIVELDKKGNERKVLQFDTKIEAVHSQLRQIKKLKNGNYLLPLMGRREVVEINEKGDVLKSYKAEGNVFGVLELKNGNLLISCGDAHCYMEVDRKSGNIVKKVAQNDLEGISLQFVAEITPYKDHLFIANWSGHSSVKNAPQVIELDADGRVVWSLNDREHFGQVSAVFPVK